ncbi:MAG TPA: MFS transporter [Solirubrobacteraceae bacterium]|nr:MFS transporter [Solirubrobacteraceae bacterium]
MRTRRWRVVGALSVTVTVSYGILYYAFAAFLVPMQRDLGVSAQQLTGAFSLGLLVSGVTGIAVGRHLDRHAAHGLMTAGSIAAALLVLAWSRVEGLVALYALWLALGAVMATVLYEVAFTVLAKAFPEPAERRQAMTAMTLVGALASFVFVPLAQALIDALGWRDALVVLAAILAATTVPLHLAVLRLPPGSAAPPAPAPAPASAALARDVLRSRPFWLLSAAFFLASIAAIAMTVHTIPFLLERGHGAAFAAFAVGLIGLSQLPGRILFGPVTTRLPRPHATASVFALMAAGVTVTVGVHATWAALAGLVLLGMGNGMATLSRATAIADLYGGAAYGTIAGVPAALTNLARAGGPFAAAVVAAAAGYDTLLWLLAALAAAAALLAFRAEAMEAARPPRSVPGA